MARSGFKKVTTRKPVLKGKKSVKKPSMPILKPKKPATRKRALLEEKSVRKGTGQPNAGRTRTQVGGDVRNKQHGTTHRPPAQKAVPASAPRPKRKTRFKGHRAV